MPIDKTTDQIFEEIPAFEKKLSLKEKFLANKILFLAGGGLLFLLLILAALAAFLPPKAPAVLPPTLPTPTPTLFEERITSPSAYATDSAILTIDAELREIEKKLDSTDLKEAALNPPVLDMAVDFNEK